MNQTQWLIVIVCTVVLWLIVRFIYDRLKAQREKPVYRAVADSLNFIFCENAGLESLPRRDEFMLFTGKDSQHIPYMLSGTIGNLEIKIVDYVYSAFSSSQESQRRSKQETLVIFQSPDQQWPDLMMLPDSFALKLTKILGFKDIDIDDAPEFSKRYLLNGSDEAAIRKIFRLEVTDAFIRNKKWCLEAHGDVIVFRIKDKRVPPKQIEGFLEETTKLFQLLTRTR